MVVVYPIRPFSPQVPYLSIYSTYVSNYGVSVKLLTTLTDSLPEFARSLDEIAMTCGAKLSDLLVVPVQRTYILPTSYSLQSFSNLQEFLVIAFFLVPSSSTLLKTVWTSLTSKLHLKKWKRLQTKFVSPHHRFSLIIS